MHKYCRAYLLHQLRQFQGWQEHCIESDPALTDDTIVYLWDDFMVVTSPILNQAPLFADVTPQWQEFCEQVLHFSIPEDLQYAYQADK